MESVKLVYCAGWTIRVRVAMESQPDTWLVRVTG
jgi:hypothetical protein